MMGTRTRLCSGDEFDAFTGLRRQLAWKPGERRAAKKAHNRRERKRRRLAVQTLLSEALMPRSHTCPELINA